MDIREIIARRAAQELKDGEVANLGFGMLTQAVNYLPEGINLIMHTQNGAFGIGPRPKCSEANSDISNTGAEPITLLPGASCMPTATSLAAMRKIH